MNQTSRILVALAILILIIGMVVTVEGLRGKSTVQNPDTTLEPGEIPIFRDGQLVAAFKGDDLTGIPQVQFIDKEEGKTQEGWLVSEVFAKFFDTKHFSDALEIVFTSSSRNKSVTLSWGEIKNPDHMVMFDLSGRGTLKLVSLLEKLDTRDEWVQDMDKIEVIEP